MKSIRSAAITAILLKRIIKDAILSALGLSFIVAAGAYAEYYKYTASDGTTTFTDNLSNIPEEQRSRVEALKEPKSSPQNPAPSAPISRDSSRKPASSNATSHPAPTSPSAANKALFDAVAIGSVEGVRAALASGAQLTVEDFGQQALVLATEKGHLAIIELLVLKGVEINRTDRFGRTALTAAIWRNQTKAAELLIHKGANVNLHASGINVSGQNISIPLVAAAINGRLEIAELLLRGGAAVDLAEREGLTALGVAVQKGATKMAALLLDHGADPNRKIADQWELDRFKARSILMVAASKGFDEIARMLIKKGADVNAKDERGNTALILAAKSDQVEVAQRLLNAKANPNAEGAFGVTSLAIAAGDGNLELAKILLRAGANPNFELSHHGLGGTAIHFAAANGYREVVALLLEHGAAVDTRDRDGETPLIKAASQAEHDGESRGLDIVELLLKKGADINAVSKMRGSALTAAASHGSEKTVDYLLKKGADVFSLDGYKKDALYWAVNRCDAPVIRRLIRAGADLKKHYVVETVLMFAVQRCTDTQAIEALIEGGADVNDANQVGNTALDEAERFGRAKTAALLRAKGARKGKSVSHGLKITSPKDGDHFIEGDTVKVTVRPTGNASELVFVAFFIALSDNESPCMKEIHRPPYKCSFKLPPGSAPRVHISAIGRTFKEAVYSDSIELSVGMPSGVTLKELKLYPDDRSIDFVKGITSEKVYVSGLYSDGTKRDLNSSASGTLYESSNPKVVTVDAEGLLRRGEGGQTFITIRNGDKQAKVEVIVPVLKRILIEPNPATIVLQDGHYTLQLKVIGILSHSDRHENITHASEGTSYQSSDQKVVRVGRNGNLHAVGKGRAEVTVRNEGVSTRLPIEIK